MSTLFDSPKRRISRAREHITDAGARTRAFFDRKPYVQVNEPAEDGWIEYKLKLAAEIPPAITDLAHEATEALRSALDQAIYPIAIAAKCKRLDKIHFPTADTEGDFENAFNSYLKELPDTVKTYLRSLKVYKDGDVLLWGLNRARRQSTHRMIVPVGQVVGSMKLKEMKASGGMQLPMPVWNREKDELVLVRVAPGEQVTFDGYNLRFHLTFGPSEGLAGLPVIETLILLADRVEQVVLALEAEYSRIPGVT